MKSFLSAILIIFTIQLSTTNTINCQTTYQITSSLAGKVKHKTELNSLTTQNTKKTYIKAKAESFKAQFNQTVISKKLAKLDYTEKIGAISKKLKIASCD